MSGVITIDGKPLESGSIIFSSPEESKLGISSGSSVVDGKYELLALPGTKSVKITSVKEVRLNVFKNLVPPKYNSKTTLEAEVTEDAEDAEPINFELSSD